MNWYEVVYFNEAQPEFAIYFIHFDATYLACIIVMLLTFFSRRSTSFINFLLTLNMTSLLF